MTDKVSCTRCGVPILPATAARNDGLCAPCSRGNRKNIEEGKRYWIAERERDRSDPFRLHWKSLVNRVHGTEAGFSGLSEPEQLYFAVSVLEGDVYNGGFDQYFHNSSSDYYALAVRGLECMGATQALELLCHAKEVLFADATVPGDQGGRWELRRMTVGESDAVAQLDPLDHAYWRDPDGMAARLQAFALQHGLVKSDQ